ncbi:hypothetical protein D1AOALGA4SA_5351 [Olavius algarvensis Delta 1 endosymbiont]|nr:hypothetical protein D1AOALGA4SA_5351 [Olavius algarvensis Delta 1 endosymbiont]
MSVWIKELLKNLDEYVDEPIREKIMGACGEKCPFTHLSDDKLIEIKNASENEDEFLKALCQQWYLINEDGEYVVVFDQCYCPFANEGIQGLSKKLCYCSLGNIKRKFAIGLGREVDVIMKSAILAGDKECRFYIKLAKAYRDREETYNSPLPHHAAYGSELRGSADQASSTPGEQKPK